MGSAAGVAVIPGSASDSHIRENLLQGTKHFVLDKDMDAIDSCRRRTLV